MDEQTYRQQVTAIYQENLEAVIRMMQAMVEVQRAANSEIVRAISDGAGVEYTMQVMTNCQEAVMVYNILSKCLQRSGVDHEYQHMIARDIERERRMIDALR